MEKRETAVLSQHPCWKHLSPEAFRARMAELVQGIEEAAAAEREKLTKPDVVDSFSPSRPEENNHE
jgi:hypothetical protein